jgi:hypothetical protein
MRGCAPPSEPRRRARRAALIPLAIAAALAGGCSSRVLRVVDPQAPPAPLLVDLVGWWDLDDDTGSLVARDLSTYGNHGTLVDADPASAWVPGRSESSLELRGASYVLVPRTPSIDAIVDQVTVSAWIYFEGTVFDYSTAISREIGATINQHYHLALNSGELPSLFISTLKPATAERPDPQLVVAQPTGPAAAPRFTWIHLAGTYDGTNACLYVDGALVNCLPITGPFQPDTTPVVLGGNGNGSGSAAITERFAGRVDEVMLYRRALSADEIGQLHAGVLFPDGR